MKLSVVLAVYNEEANLGDCLEAVKNLACEIIIVDGGSKDKTLEIAKKYKAKIIETDNPLIFHINKNRAIKNASCDWVLQLDADEIVTKELEEEIKKILETDSDINGYWIPRRNFFLGTYLKKGGQYPDYTLRFYRRGKGTLPGKSVHEQAVVEGKVGYLKNDLLHLRDKNFTVYLERLSRYTDLLSSEIKEKRVKINLYSFLQYIFFKPIFWFLKAYIRHKGFMDGFPGFVFALFSALRFPIAYVKYIEKYYENRN